jgi:hypothetical protein
MNSKRSMGGWMCSQLLKKLAGKSKHSESVDVAIEAFIRQMFSATAIDSQKNDVFLLHGNKKLNFLHRSLQ